MAKNVEKKALDVNGKVVNLGADVHKRSWHVTALVEGAVVWAGSMPPVYAALRKLLDRSQGATVRVAYEAGPAGFDLYDRLTQEGIGSRGWAGAT